MTFTTFAILNGMLSIGSAVAYALRSDKSFSRLEEHYYIKPNDKETSNNTINIKEILKGIMEVLLLMVPIVSGALLLWSLFSKDKDFDKVYKKVLTKYNIFEKKDPNWVSDEEKEALNPKKKFNIKEWFKNKINKKVEKTKPNKSKELIEELNAKLEEQPKEEPKPSKSKELIDELQEKLGGEVKIIPKESEKPIEPTTCYKTALQPEGQLPFEIVWENDHVYSGTVRSLKR